jgi:Na+/melibiose symporter-like transporter
VVCSSDGHVRATELGIGVGRVIIAIVLVFLRVCRLTWEVMYGFIIDKVSLETRGNE